MSRRLTNLLLLAFLAGAFLSGWTAFGIGTGWVRLPLVIHAVLGFAVVALVPWKSVIVRHGLKANTGRAATSLALLLLVTVTIASGLLFSTVGVRSYGPLTAMQIHVGGGTLALILTLVHVRQRPVRPRGDRPGTAQPAPGRGGARCGRGRLRRCIGCNHPAAAAGPGSPRNRLVRARIRRPGRHAGHLVAE
ncbi:MAG: hypothetical protein HKO70_05105 [Acidimicrobiia bacterium]|nr:hypothetical protein [Acidimicrobiia bacterium]